MAVILNRSKQYLHRYYPHISLCYRYSNHHHSTPHLAINRITTSNPNLSNFSPPSTVRFFAAPIQFLKKEEAKKVTGVRLNEQIKADFVRLVSDEGHSVLARHEALRQAKSLKLDLVEVDRHAKPPVCKILDYNKERYQQQVKDKERAKKKSEGSLKKGDCKEVRFSAKTETKDLKMKAETAKRLMERGYRVKCMVMGTEDQDLGGLISQLSSMIDDVAFVETGPRIEKRQAYIIVRHIKFGLSKKGGKKASKVEGTHSSEIHNVADTCNNSHVELEEEASSSSEDYATDEGDVASQGQEETVCRVSAANRGFDPIHERNSTSSATAKQMKFDTKVATSTVVGLSPSRMPNFVDQNVRSSSQEPEPENRYARSVSKNGSAARNTRFPDNGSQPRFPGSFVQGGGPRQDRSRGEVSIPHQAGRTEPGTGPGSRHSPSSDFGIFSAREVNRRESPSNDTARNSHPDKVNSQSVESSGDQRRGNNDGRKWGVFSR